MRIPYFDHRLLSLSMLLVWWLALSSTLSAQDLSAFGSRLRQEGLNITGNLNFSHQAYGASGIMPRRDVGMTMVRAGLNLRFLDFSAPFSLVLSDRNSNFNLPAYSFIGISPRYKWATLHAGDRSMNFSKYTMNGISFRGVGLELQPGKWQAAFFSGRLNRALANDLTAAGNLNDFYQRRGMGARVGYGDQNSSYFINFFSAKDEQDVFPDTDLGNQLQATENMVVSVQGRQRFGKKLSLFGELAHAVYNQDQGAAALAASNSLGAASRMWGLFTPNESLQSGQAFNIGGQYNLGKTGLQATYERIDRGFRTLGALFFNNDTENITAGINRTFFEDKLQLMLNAGVERVNLDDQEQEATDRFIGSANVSYRPDDKWMLSGMYGNFRNDTKLRVRTDLTVPVDSIFLAQVNQSANIMVLRRLGSEERPSSVQFFFNHQRASNVVNDAVQENAESQFSTASLSYSSGSPSDGLQWNTGLTVNFISLGSIRNRSLAPVFGLNKALWNNALLLNATTALSFFQEAGNDDNKVLNLQFGGRYQLRNSHRVGLSAMHISRFGSEDALRNFGEWYGQINYGYQFGGQIGGKKETTNPSN